MTDLAQDVDGSLCVTSTLGDAKDGRMCAFSEDEDALAPLALPLTASQRIRGAKIPLIVRLSACLVSFSLHREGASESVSEYLSDAREALSLLVLSETRTLARRRGGKEGRLVDGQCSAVPSKEHLVPGARRANRVETRDV